MHINENKTACHKETKNSKNILQFKINNLTTIFLLITKDLNVFRSKKEKGGKKGLILPNHEVIK